MQNTFAPSGYYWFQVGAMPTASDTSSQNSDGASITIRTVYDQVRNDAHSYWVGTLLSSTGGFVQVGYLNGLSTTGQPYCCAWFFETFDTPGCSCPPVIGAEGSAGPIGSWHTYSMRHVGNGVWSFYMDGQLLGSSPAPGSSDYLGAGATNSGSDSPGAIAEVAQASDYKDIIGPAEFKDLEIHQGGVWKPMPSAANYSHVGFGSLSGQPNYGVSEVEGTDRDFLVGTAIRQLQPASGASLWPTSVLFPHTVSFSFLDANGNSFPPDWIALEDPGNGNIIYYTTYQSQSVPSSSSGTYSINYAYWHGVNVAKISLVSDSAPNQIVQGNVFSIPVRVVGRFYSLPVTGATVLTFLPDSTNQTSKTDSTGNATLSQLPPGNYSLHVTVPYGVPTTLKTNLQGPGNLSVPVFSIAELLTIIFPPIAIAVAVVIVALRREQARAAAMQIPTPYSIPIPAAYCGACGKPFGPTELFCTTCGTPRITPPQLTPQQPPPSPAPTSPPPPSA